MRSAKLILSLVFFALFASAQDDTRPYYDNEDEIVKKPFKFIVFGDWGRNGEDNQKKVARQMGAAAKKFKPEFIVSTGDNFYPNGVRSTHDHNWLASYEDIYTAHSLQTDWYIVLGNHDYGGEPQAEIDYSAVDRKWNMPARYYSKVFYINGDTALGMLFVFLDTSPFLTEYYLGDKGALETIDHFTRKPDRFSRRLQNILALPTANPCELESAVHQMHILWKEVVDLTDGRYVERI